MVGGRHFQHFTVMARTSAVRLLLSALVLTACSANGGSAALANKPRTLTSDSLYGGLRAAEAADQCTRFRDRRAIGEWVTSEPMIAGEVAKALVSHPADRPPWSGRPEGQEAARCGYLPQDADNADDLVDCGDGILVLERGYDEYFVSQDLSWTEVPSDLREPTPDCR